MISSAGPKERSGQSARALPYDQRVWSARVVGAGVAMLLISAGLNWYSSGFDFCGVQRIPGPTSVCQEQFSLTGVHLLLWNDTRSVTVDSSVSYAGIGLAPLGLLYSIAGLLLVAAIGLGAGFVAALWKGRIISRPRLVAGLGLGCVALALLAPLLVGLLQPTYIGCQAGSTGSGCGWYQGGPANHGYIPGPSGPEAAFFGAGTVAGDPWSWGPGPGWYLALGAFSVILGGLWISRFGLGSRGWDSSDELLQSTARTLRAGSKPPEDPTEAPVAGLEERDFESGVVLRRDPTS